MNEMNDEGHDGAPRPDAGGQRGLRGGQHVEFCPHRIQARNGLFNNLFVVKDQRLLADLLLERPPILPPDAYSLERVVEIAP